MHKIDLPLLVRDALHAIGCDPSLIGNLDAHSTIVLEFREYPPLLVEEGEEGIWIWSQIMEYQPSVVKFTAPVLLEQALKPFDAAISRGVIFGKSEDGLLEMRVLLDPAFLVNGTEFAYALNAFFERLDEVVQGLKQ